MATADVTYSFTAHTLGESAQVDTNFQDLVDFLNTEVVQRDGTTVMTGQLSLVGDPTDDSHAARKAYVDNAATGYLGMGTRVSNITGIGTGLTDLTGYGLTTTVTVKSGHRIKLTVSAVMQQVGSGGTPILRIYEGSSQKVQGQIALGVSETGSIQRSVVLTPTAGSHTYHVRGLTTANTCTVAASSDDPAYILAEDLG